MEKCFKQSPPPLHLGEGLLSNRQCDVPRLKVLTSIALVVYARYGVADVSMLSDAQVVALQKNKAHAAHQQETEDGALMAFLSQPGAVVPWVRNRVCPVLLECRAGCN